MPRLVCGHASGAPALMVRNLWQRQCMRSRVSSPYEAIVGGGAPTTPTASPPAPPSRLCSRLCVATHAVRRSKAVMSALKMAANAPAKLGYRTTALEALRGADLRGKVAVVTGEHRKRPWRVAGRGAATGRRLVEGRRAWCRVCPFVFSPPTHATPSPTGCLSAFSQQQRARWRSHNAIAIAPPPLARCHLPTLAPNPSRWQLRHRTRDVPGAGARRCRRDPVLPQRRSGRAGGSGAAGPRGAAVGNRPWQRRGRCCRC